MSVLWEVVRLATDRTGLVVRATKELTSDKLEKTLPLRSVIRQINLQDGRLNYELVCGDGPERGWVSVIVKGRELLQRLPARDSADLALEEGALLCTDALGKLRGACRCCDCQAWKLEGFTALRWHTKGQNSIDVLLEQQTRKKEAHKFPNECQRCGCKWEHHENLTEWLESVQRTVKLFRERLSDPGVTPADRQAPRGADQVKESKDRTVPRDSSLPVEALSWSPVDVALYLLSLGRYNPRRDGRDQNESHSKEHLDTSQNQQGILVSVITPTSEKRHSFHPLLYENFCRQSHEPRELVVIDTGSQPSHFLQHCAQTDPRVVYRFFADVVDSKQADLMDAIIVRDDASGTRMSLSAVRPKSLKKSWIEKEEEPASEHTASWSLGLKRNIGINIARGDVIAHFDDDDLYSSLYLEHMLSELQRVKGMTSLSKTAALATLSEWHLFDALDLSFGWFDPKTDPLVEEGQRECFQYGYGFSYIYTRAAWERAPFPDVEYAEDGEFSMKLLYRDVPIRFVKTKGILAGLAAHTYHADTTSAGEFVRNVRLGHGVDTPECFKQLLPKFQEICHSDGVKTTKCHEMRREMFQLLERTRRAPEEVSWASKEEYLEKHPEIKAEVKPQAPPPLAAPRHLQTFSSFIPNERRPPQIQPKGAWTKQMWPVPDKPRPRPGLVPYKRSGPALTAQGLALPGLTWATPKAPGRGDLNVPTAPPSGADV